MHSNDKTHLYHLLLSRQSVDDLDEARLFRENSDTIAFIFPPRAPKIVAPVGAGIRWCNMDETAVRCVGYYTTGDRIHVGSNIFCFRVEPMRNISTAITDNWLQQNISYKESRSLLNLEKIDTCTLYILNAEC